ncbi:MAG: ATP-binding protein [Bacteroidetes bacterium]|jgi:two-component sensor histidine kinase|nr:ATP-binding protein [Bacteroidota bacterium]
MFKKLFFSLSVVFCTCLGFKTEAQTPVLRHPSEYKTDWQRLLLQLSTTFYTAVRENQVDLDSSLIYCSHSLGLSRLPVITEGIEISGVPVDWIDKRLPETAKRLLAKANGKEHLQLLVLLGGYYAFQPDSYHHYKDSVLFYLDQAVNESKIQNSPKINRQARLLMAKMYVGGYDFQHGDPIFDQLIKDCQNAGDKITEAKVSFYRGLYTGFTPQTALKRIEYLKHAQLLYQQQNNTEGEISALTDMSYLNVATYQLDNAYKLSLEAVKLVNLIHFPNNYYNTDAVTMITIFQGKFGEPLKYALETIKNSEANRDSIGWGYYYSRVGNLYYLEDEDSKDALKWNEKSVNYLVRAGTANGLYLTLYNLTISLMKTNQLNKAWVIVNNVSKKVPPSTPFDKLFYNTIFSVCYSKFKRYDLAERYLRSADSVEKILEKNGINFRRAAITLKFGQLYFLKGEPEKAEKYFEQFLADPSRVGGTLNSELVALSFLIAIDSSKSDNLSQVRHLRLYKELADSNYKIAKTRQAEELQVKYATAEKESQIDILNQKSKLEQANLSKATLVRNLTFGGIVLIAIMAGLLYRQSLLRKKNSDIILHKNELLESLVTEKEWLLKEVHHRVKNNLHTVICLLESQAVYLENTDALKAIEISQNRIYAMSLIHQKLYQSDDVKTIDMGAYIPEFIQYLTQSFGSPPNIEVKLDVEPLKLDVSQAIPLSIIINEAVVNAFKYAFPGKKRGVISVELRQMDKVARLVIADNGIGMEYTDDDAELNSLGIELIKGLTRDIKGTLKFDNMNGTKITILFSADPFDQINMQGINIKGAVEQA